MSRRDRFRWPPQEGTLTHRRLVACINFLARTAPNTVRACCYYLFDLGLIASMEKDYTDQISNLLSRAREHRAFDWRWLVDEGRFVVEWQTFADQPAFIDATKGRYARDLWADQPRRLVIVSEKSTVGGVLRAILAEWRVPFLSMHGNASYPAIRKLAERTATSPQPWHIMYIGDYDVQGLHMSEIDFPDRLAEYGGRGIPSRLAVTRTQIDAYTLPTFDGLLPRKGKKPNDLNGWFLKETGGDRTCAELDGHDANVLRTMLTNAIKTDIDEDAWRTSVRQERREQAELGLFLDGWDDYEADQDAANWPDLAYADDSDDDLNAEFGFVGGGE